MLPLPSPPVPGSGATAARHMPHVALCSARVRGPSLPPAPGTGTLPQHPPQCHRCWANPIPAGAPTLGAVSYFFFNAPKSPVCFFNCSNHKREVSERFEPVSARKGEAQHSVPIAAAPCPGAPPPCSSAWWLLCFPSPSSCRSSPAPFLLEVRNLRLVWRCQRASGPPSADRSLCALLLPVFSVCLQPLEGSCDESSLDRIQQQLKRSPGWGWE